MEATPLAQRIARLSQIDLSGVRGSANDGTVRAQDVLVQVGGDAGQENNQRAGYLELATELDGSALNGLLEVTAMVTGEVEIQRKDLLAKIVAHALGLESIGLALDAGNVVVISDVANKGIQAMALARAALADADARGPLPAVVFDLSDRGVTRISPSVPEDTAVAIIFGAGAVAGALSCTILASPAELGHGEAIARLEAIATAIADPRRLLL